MFYFVHGEGTNHVEKKKDEESAIKCGKAYYTADCTYGIVIKKMKLCSALSRKATGSALF